MGRIDWQPGDHIEMPLTVVMAEDEYRRLVGEVAELRAEIASLRTRCESMLVDWADWQEARATVSQLTFDLNECRAERGRLAPYREIAERIGLDTLRNALGQVAPMPSNHAACQIANIEPES
jgi:hypothetical protein